MATSVLQALSKAGRARTSTCRTTRGKQYCTTRLRPKIDGVPKSKGADDRPKDAMDGRARGTSMEEARRCSSSVARWLLGARRFAGAERGSRVSQPPQSPCRFAAEHAPRSVPRLPGRRESLEYPPYSTFSRTEAISRFAPPARSWRNSPAGVEHHQTGARWFLAFQHQRGCRVAGTGEQTLIPHKPEST